MCGEIQRRAAEARGIGKAIPEDLADREHAGAGDRGLRHMRMIQVAAVVFLLAAGAGAQGPPAPVRSPEVHRDRSVTFRLRAPAAARVELVGEVLQGKGPQAMVKDADGVWSLTIGPLPP